MSNKKLYRSSTDKRISGVCGGIAEYFNVSSKSIRTIVLILALFNFLLSGIFGLIPIIIIYIIATVLIPKESEDNRDSSRNSSRNTNTTGNESGTVIRNPKIDPKDIID